MKARFGWKLGILVGALALVAAACDDGASEDGGDGGSGAGGSGAGGSGAGGSGAGGMAMQVAEPSAATAAVLAQIDGYAAWPKFAENLTPEPSAGHMNMFVVAFLNDVAEAAVAANTLPLPDGAIIVKDNLMAASDPMPMAVTIMSKQGGRWYWAEVTAEGKVILDAEGAPLEGFDVPMCVGCHQAVNDNDQLFTHDFTP